MCCGDRLNRQPNSDIHGVRGHCQRKIDYFARTPNWHFAVIDIPRFFRIDDLRPRPAPASAGDIDGEVNTTGGVCTDGGKFGQMAFQPRADLQNQAIGVDNKLK